jgi:chromate reductase
MSKIIIFSTSARAGSYNQKLADYALNYLSQKPSYEVEMLYIQSYELPLFHPDMERPSKLMQLKEKFIAADGLIVASCEYNSSFSPLFKNMIDWLSLSDLGEPPLALTAFRNKMALVCSASPGNLGGIRSTQATHLLLNNLDMSMIPYTFNLPSAHDIIDTFDIHPLADKFKQLLDKFSHELNIRKSFATE